jgi:hypothetical protein
VSHNYKGDAGQLKVKLDLEKKKDLRTNHFNIGGTSAKVVNTTNQLYLRPASALCMREARQKMDD